MKEKILQWQYNPRERTSIRIRSERIATLDILTEKIVFASTRVVDIMESRIYVMYLKTNRKKEV